uniref:Uncharacterized protein n=1 Tax=Arundo donax TaxID=35708 RepID=A0A0A8XVN6_ARUDO
MVPKNHKQIKFFLVCGDRPLDTDELQGTEIMGLIGQKK